MLDASGAPVGPGRRTIPVGLPVEASLDAARSTNARDIRETTIPIPVRGGSPGGGAEPVATGPAVTTMPVRVLTDPVMFRGRQLYVQIVGDRTTEERTLSVLIIVLVVGGAIALLVALGVGAAYASRALVPIRQSLIGQREALRRQREFAADASHELRTPLTVIRASVDDLERHPKQQVVAVGTALTDIRDEVDHLTGMVDDLLLLARSDSGAIELERVSLDLGDIASSGASALSLLAVERSVRLLVDPTPAEVSGDPARLRQLVGILVDNALRHAPAGSAVDVRVRPMARTRSSWSRTRARASSPRTCRVCSTGSIELRGRPWRDWAGPGHRGLDRGAARGTDRGCQPRPGRRAVHGPHPVAAASVHGCSVDVRRRGRGAALGFRASLPPPACGCASGRFSRTTPARTTARSRVRASHGRTSVAWP